MHTNKINHQALIGFSCFAPLIFHFLAFFSVSNGRCYLFARLLLGKSGGGGRDLFFFFLSEQLTAELTWLTIESWWRANRKECKDYPLRVLWNNELLPEGTGKESLALGLAFLPGQVKGTRQAQLIHHWRPTSLPNLKIFLPRGRKKR